MPVSAQDAAAARDRDPRWQLVPAGAASRWWAVLLGVALPLAMSLAVPLLALRSGGELGGGMLQRLWGVGWLPPALALLPWVLAVVAPIGLFVQWAMSRQRLGVDAGGIEVVSGLFRDRVALPDLALDEARVIDLDEHPEHKPFLKSGGIALPGFRSGWFRGRRLQRLFVATAGGRRVLWLPTTRKHALLLEVRQPQALLERLRELAGAQVPSGAGAARR